jgi:SAM-dependent MidA family methyltransferase
MEVLERHGLGPSAELDAETFNQRQEVKRLLDPEGMGADLKVLVQGRGAVVDVVREHLALRV